MIELPGCLPGSLTTDYVFSDGAVRLSLTISSLGGGDKRTGHNVCLMRYMSGTRSTRVVHLTRYAGDYYKTRDRLGRNFDSYLPKDDVHSDSTEHVLWHENS